MGVISFYVYFFLSLFCLRLKLKHESKFHHCLVVLNRLNAENQQHQVVGSRNASSDEFHDDNL